MKKESKSDSREQCSRVVIEAAENGFTVEVEKRTLSNKAGWTPGSSSMKRHVAKTKEAALKIAEAAL